MSVRIEARDYAALPEHSKYAAELGLLAVEFESALRDLRDKHGGKKHDESWLDDRLCSFLEQVARSKSAPRGTTAADERTRVQLERVAMLEAQEREAANGGAR